MIKYLLKISIICLPLIVFSQQSFSQENLTIYTVNVNNVINSSKAWKNFRKNIEKDHTSFRDRARDLQENLEKESNDLIKQQNLLSREALIEKETSLRQKQRNYDEELGQTRKRLEQRQAKAQNMMRQAIFEAVKEISAKKNIDIVLNSGVNGAVIIVNQKLDLTEDVLKKINKNLPTLKLDQ